MVNDPVGDMLTQIRNAAMAGKKVIELPHSKLKTAVSRILASEGYLESVETIGESPWKQLRLVLAYQEGRPVIIGVRRVSKPGLRWYVNQKTIPKVMGGMGMAIVSTPLGVMTGKDARAKKIGGELLCEVW